MENIGTGGEAGTTLHHSNYNCDISNLVTSGQVNIQRYKRDIRELEGRPKIKQVSVVKVEQVFVNFNDKQCEDSNTSFYIWFGF